MCISCGVEEDLEFDHIDRREKAHHVSRILSRKWEILKEELDKCQLLCNSCHINKSIEVDIPQWQGTLYKHGTQGMYSNHGCRCDLCRKSHRELAREFRASGKKW